ncbi:serine hydrolase [Pseudoalteromonas sp. SMS1]|uniref:serine hydrolase n=1 Tax=Pseudoalteromonas sp. SMS1 TaxID=2908894 RepID=UPI001F1FA777|nr:serine hydrolase [Pseudoalteromonas sp. SMS1]MCF2860149.1 serine hydrolase [Pseudoalteromonas sp. SMS1]
MNYTKKLFLTGAFFLHALTASSSYSAELGEQQIDALVKRAQNELNVPGIALAVIKGDHVIHAKGYGIQSIADNKPVKSDTLFQIGSISKSFLTAALAILVDDKKIAWDDKVIDYLPQFQMYDPWVTREFTIRDLLTHRSGLPLGAGDLLQWPDAKSSPDEIIAALRHLKPQSSFRSRYAYNNLMYGVAEEVIRAVTGMPWDRFVEKEILIPLNMTGCVAHSARITTTSERATPHMVVDEKLQTTFFKEGDLINCHIEGMAKWAKLHLSKGQLSNGEALISPQRQHEMWQPVTLQPVSYMAKTYSQTHFQAYGLGWRLMDFHGHMHVSHGGAVQGMASHMAFLPELDVAVIALTNQWSRAAQGLTATILESYITEKPTDYIDLYIDGKNRYKARQKSQKPATEPTTTQITTPTLALEDYAGSYHDTWYGEVSIKKQADQLHIKFSRSDALEGTLLHLHGNRFIAKWNDRTLNADAYVNFEMDFEGKVKTIKMKAVNRSTDFSYNFHDLLLKKRSQ